MANLWSFKLLKRKDAYWNMVKNQEHQDKYQDCVKWENNIVPRSLQIKEFNYDNYEQACQKAVRGKAAFNDFKAEIEFRDLRAKQHEQRCKQLGEEMESCLKTKSSGRVFSTLIQMLNTETSLQETISNRRWQHRARWLNEYETNFLQNNRG